MAWTAQQMAEKRAKLQKTSTAAGGSPSQSAQSAASSPKGGAGASTRTAASNGSETWTADKMAAKRAALRAAKPVQGSAAANQLEKAYEDYRTGNNLGFAAEQQGAQTVKPVTGIGAGVTLGDKYANAAQALKNSYADYSQPDAFDRANQWYDQKRNQELVKKMTETKETGTYTSYAQMGTSAGGSADPFRTGNVVKKYSTADLEKMGYSADEIAQARNYLDTMKTLPVWQRGVRRTANAIGGAADVIASLPFMTGENLVQAVKNVGQSNANQKALAAQVAANPREKNLYDRLMETDMDYQPKYSTGDLLQQGFTRQEIEDMRARIAGTEADAGVDPEKSVGYQMYDRGQQLTGAAMSGLTEAQKRAMGIVTSAGENLGITALNPWAVLPVLSGQGAADAMAQAMEQGQSAGKTLASGAMKFGAGWAINSVAVADLAKTMGAGAAKDSVAGQIAEWVRKVSSSEALREKYPAIANAISGGIDNAMQAFVETYADQAIDAALGDSEAAQSLLTRDTFLQALESGLTGGASGALGGAVGTGLAKLNAGDASLLGNAEYYAAQADYEQAVQEQQRRQALAQEPGQAAEETAEPSQSKPDGFASSPEGGARGGSGEAEAGGVESLSHAARDSSPAEGSPWQDGQAVLDEQGTMEREAQGAAAEGSGRTVENPGETVESAGAKSDNAAVRAYAEAVQSDSLTAKTIKLFAPEAGNEANRAAFTEAYGVELPGTASATRRALREVAAQENAAKNAANAEQQAATAAETAAATTAASGGSREELLGQRPAGREQSETTAGSRNPAANAEPAAQTEAGPEGDILTLDGAVGTGLARMRGYDAEEGGSGAAEAETGLRETYGMQEEAGRSEQQRGTERTLKSWGVSEQAAKEIGQKLPEGTDADRYAAAASTLYRLGQLEDVKSFDQALELAGSGSGMAANVNYVLGSVTGRNALEIAYTYGKDAAGTRWESSRLGGNLTEQSRTGKGETLYAGTTRSDSEAASRVIELNAAATGTTAVMKNVLRNESGRPDSRVRAYVDTETGRIFFGDSATDAFGTVLHEDWHWYNALDAEGGQQLMDHALEYLARANGFETVDEMIRGRMADYAGQGLTYEEAAEELVGDAWRGIFSTEEDFRRWVQFQKGQAEKNAGKSGTIRKVMDRVKEMLGGIVNRAKEILSADPENEAARRAQRLAEKERRILQDEYFAHAEKAMDNLRSAKENAAALKNESAAEKKNISFQKAEQADRESRKNIQRQASRAIADNSVMLETLGEMMGITHGVRISQDSIEGLTLRWTKTNGSKADRTKLAGETRALVEYLESEGADMSKAQSLAETLAGEVLDGATYRNTELWDLYPEFHELSYTVNKDGQAKAELVKRYGSWSEAVAEARRHGVKLRQAEGVRDGNPAEQYESIVNDTLAMGGGKDGAAALFRQAAKQAGVYGAASMESTEWLDILMNVRDAIKPKVMSRFEDVAEYEDAKVELAGRMIGDILNTPEMNDAQAIFESFQKWQRYAVAAAVGEENVDAALKELRKVQKDQSRDFNRRLYENRRKGSRNEALQKLAEMQVSNAKAEELLDRNLETLGVDITNSGDLAEKLDLLKEAYERGWKEEKKRLREERQDMIDSIRLENQKLKRENYALSYEVAGEQKRADAAEWQLIHQQNEMMEWEDENQRKAQAWQEEQARRNAIAVEVARQQRDEDISIARKAADKRVAKAREMRDRDVTAAKESRDRDVAKAREMRDRDIAWAEQVAARRVEIARAGRRKDEYRRIIRNNRAQLNQMILHPSKDKYVQPHLIKQAAAVAQIADMALVNDSTMSRLTRLRDSIADEIGKEASPSGMSTDWDNSGIKTMIEALTKSMSDTKEAKLDRLRGQLAEAEALPESDKARDLRASLERRIRETEKQPYQPMTADQLQLLKAITTSTLHVIRTANKTLSQEKAEAVDKIAQDAAEEVIRSKGNGGTLRNALTKYNLDMLGGTRVFRMLGGYTKNGQMEKLGTMLNDGQRRQTEIIVEGTHKFDNVTGKDNLRQMESFAGPGAELVDLGLKDAHGKAVPLTHAQMCSLYMHLRNADSREHLMSGGFTVPNAEAYNRGEIEEAYQKGQTVRIGIMTDSEGKPVADTIVNAIEKNLTDYDKLWIADMQDFFDSYTTDLINETSMKLLGFRRATVKNYYPIAVDRTALASQIEGVKLDATIEGRGFLKERVKSQKPILLEECSSVVQRSLRDTAAYAGLAPAIRDVQKVLSCGIETVDGIKVLKDGILKEKWGSSAVNYVNDLLTDLQTKQRQRDNGITRAMKKLRGNYAGAILTLNPGVAIAQAASLPTAGAVLGADTMAAVVPFVKNLSGKQRAALEAEIAEHGDALLQYRLRGSRQGELASVGVDRGLVQNAMDKLPKGLTGWISTMDEITVASLWEGAKRYVEHHENLTATDGDSYWTAVNRMYQKVIEETQPNYTTMQRAGIQRNPSEMVKSMTMFTTQRFQNYGILADAVMDYNAQRTRYRESRSADAKAELERAGQNLSRAVTSQVIQTAVFALMKIGADFLLHRWDREQDENGDITALSMAKRFAGLYTESAAGNFLYGSELYTLVNNAIQGKDYDVVSATNISAVNDLATSVLKLERLLKKDTSEMDEDELKAHHAKVQAAWVSVAEYGLSIKGVPAANVQKIVEAFKGYAGDVEKMAKGEGFSFNSLPASATGQYDRLYNAIQSGDSEEAKAALEKLEGMGKDEKTIGTQLKNRLKKYSPEVEQAAKARNAGSDRERQAVTVQLIREMYEAMGIREGVKADADKRSAVIDLVTGAIDQKADSLLAGDKDRTVYSDLTDALDGGRRKDVQEEIVRLRTAGKEDDAIRSKITAAVKEEYLAGNDRDREKLEELLLSLTKADGTAMYEEKTFVQWVNNAEKAAEKTKNTTDEWAGVR